MDFLPDFLLVVAFVEVDLADGCFCLDFRFGLVNVAERWAPVVPLLIARVRILTRVGSWPKEEDSAVVDGDTNEP